MTRRRARASSRAKRVATKVKRGTAPKAKWYKLSESGHETIRNAPKKIF